jgi:hypothetical protein
MDANTYTMPDRQLDATAHGLGIASVETTGDVCRADQWKNVLVWSRPVDTKALSEVTINIHATHGKLASRKAIR